MFIFGSVVCALLQGTHDHMLGLSHAWPLTARAGVYSSAMAGHLPWPLSLFSWWHFSPLLDETNYLFWWNQLSFFPQECVNYVTVNVAAKGTSVLLSVKFTLKSWHFILRPFSFLSAFWKCSSCTVIVFCCLFWYESVCTWHSCQSVFLYV